MELQRIEYTYRQQQDRYGKWKSYVAYILAIDENDAKKYLKSKLGKDNVFVKLVEGINIHGITDYMVETIITDNINVYENIKGIKKAEKRIDDNHMNVLLSRKQAEWYEVDAVINDGNEAKKDKKKASSIWKNF